MRHVLLAMAHNNWKQLTFLLQQIDAPNHDIYLHIDLKSEKDPLDEIKEVVYISKLQIYREFKIYWGTVRLKRSFFYLKQHQKNTMIITTFCLVQSCCL